MEMAPEGVVEPGCCSQPRVPVWRVPDRELGPRTSSGSQTLCGSEAVAEGLW